MVKITGQPKEVWHWIFFKLKFNFCKEKFKDNFYRNDSKTW